MKRNLKLLVFTDYACPFCDIAAALCDQFEEKTGDRILPVYIEIHSDMPEVGCATEKLIPNAASLNKKLEELGRPYGIRPKLGKHLSNSEKAIMTRYFLGIYYPEIVSVYDKRMHRAYAEELLDISDNQVLYQLLLEIDTDRKLEDILYAKDKMDENGRIWNRLYEDMSVRKKYEQAKKEAAFYFVDMTPTFIIGRKKVKGIVTVDELVRIFEEQKK